MDNKVLAICIKSAILNAIDNKNKFYITKALDMASLVNTNDIPNLELVEELKKIGIKYTWHKLNIKGAEVKQTGLEYKDEFFAIQ